MVSPSITIENTVGKFDETVDHVVAYDSKVRNAGIRSNCDVNVNVYFTKLSLQYAALFGGNYNGDLNSIQVTVLDNQKF